MDAYLASLAKLCLTLSGIENFFTGNVPQEFRIPALYFPPPEETPEAWSMGGYAVSYAVYTKVFAATREDALSFADAISRGIMARRRLVPLLAPDGTKTGEAFKTGPPEARIIDEGVAQVLLSYRLIRPYTEEEAEKIKKIYIREEVNGF